MVSCRSIFVGVGLILAGIGMPKLVNAQKKPKNPTVINFEDELIEGKIKKPDLWYLMQKKQFNFKRLIKLRKDFIPEMKRTAEDISRGDGE